VKIILTRKEYRAIVLISYASKKLSKICTEESAVRKHLNDPKLIRAFAIRLDQLEAYSNLGEIQVNGSPLYLHPLRNDKSGQWTVRIYKRWRICFKPYGNYEVDKGNNPVRSNVTEIEIVSVEDYHNG